MTETRIEDRSYDVVRNVYETAEREERVVVARPVYETQEREERTIVQRPVTETSEREEYYNVMEQVTTYRAVQVDQGGFVDQTTYQPGAMTPAGLAAVGLCGRPQHGSECLSAWRIGLGADASPRHLFGGPHLAAEPCDGAGAAN